MNVKYILVHISVLFLLNNISGQNLEISSPVRFLALGDSYTIGQSVAVNQRWPTQLSDSLKKRNFTIDFVDYIATTGWRTDNLNDAIKNKNLHLKNYNLVSLLIGVNNQYQNALFSKYENEFPALLDSAIRYAGGDVSKVMVVSIPDYAFTPFGQSTGNPNEISADLDRYNAYAKQIAAQKNVVFFDITPISRLGVQQPQLVANDGLHPSGIQYTEWVKLILEYIDGSVSATKKTSSESLFKVFPNPVRDELKIVLSETSFISTNIQILDISGKLVYNNSFSTDSISIPTLKFTNGQYLVKIMSGQRSETSKIVINH